MATIDTVYSPYSAAPDTASSPQNAAPGNKVAYSSDRYYLKCDCKSTDNNLGAVIRGYRVSPCAYVLTRTSSASAVLVQGTCTNAKLGVSTFVTFGLNPSMDVCVQQWNAFLTHVQNHWKESKQDVVVVFHARK